MNDYLGKHQDLKQVIIMSVCFETQMSLLNFFFSEYNTVKTIKKLKIKEKNKVQMFFLKIYIIL